LFAFYLKPTHGIVIWACVGSVLLLFQDYSICRAQKQRWEKPIMEQPLAEKQTGLEAETAQDAPSEQGQGSSLSLKNMIPLLFIVSGVGLAFYFDLHHWISLEKLQTYNSELLAMAEKWWAPFVFMGVYMLVVAFSLPVGTVLTVTGGYLFGMAFGTAYAVTGATLGATVLFLATRTSLGTLLKAKAGPWLKKAEDGFRENAVSYMLFMRLVPAFPFFVVNLLPAFLGVRTWTYLWTTFIGIIPGAFVFVSVGAGLESVLGQGQDLTLEGVLTKEIIIALVGFGLLALLPIAVKKLRGARS